MGRLVAVVAEGTPSFVERLRRVWDAGDAVLPLDPRLPPPAAEIMLRAMRPAAVIGPDGDEVRLDGAEAVADGDALVVATSGTTGAPRGAVLTHDAVVTSAVATSARLGVDPDRDRWLACLPLAHVGGLSVVTRALVTGTPLEVAPRPDPVVLAGAAARGATLVSLVATALARVDTSAYRAVLLGGGAPPAATTSNVVTTYGMTETGSGVVYDGVPLDGVEVRVVGGEVHVRGPMLLRAYRDGTDPRDADGWLATGDSGALGSDGRLHVDGRLGDVIVTGGEKVWPDPVEAVLRAHRGVADVAVVGRDDPEWGQRVVAHVVPTDPADPPTLDALRQAVKARLPAWSAPRELVLEADLPRTALGKVRRRQVGGRAQPA
ncbi:MAG TPA: AMP-binding protein [Acidimicrobiales bacterium]|nr:AMP-binding protein [Acidimicrobiales bacterium]